MGAVERSRLLLGYQEHYGVLPFLSARLFGIGGRTSLRCSDHLELSGVQPIDNIGIRLEQRGVQQLKAHLIMSSVSLSCDSFTHVTKYRGCSLKKESLLG